MCPVHARAVEAWPECRLNTGSNMADLSLRKHEQESRDGAGHASLDRRLQRTALLALLACTLVAMTAAGCALPQSRVIEVDPSTFRSVVLGSNQPVLINFYKDG